MGEEPKIRVFNVDDHSLLNEGIAAIINSQPDMKLVAQATSGNDAVRQFRQHQPDVTLMDLRLPDMSGIDTMIAIRAEFPEARIIMLTTFQGDVEIQRALEAGARGYLLKSMPPKEMVEVIRQVHVGKQSISSEVAARLGEQHPTNRELQIRRQIAGGSRKRNIAERVFVAEEGARDRTNAVVTLRSRILVLMRRLRDLIGLS
jgi:DNA-binding NarL/FixJ family response regulator